MMEFPHIQMAVEHGVPELVRHTWQELAAEASDTGSYTADVSFVTTYPYEGKPLAVAVSNVSDHAAVLEEGHEGYHLPSKIDWGAAVSRGTAKQGRDGKRYLTVPLRHTTPGAAAGGLSASRRRTMMSREVYRDATEALRRADGQRSREAAARLRQAGTRMSKHYGLMARSIPSFPAGLLERTKRQAGQPGYTWKSRTYEGLTHREQKSPAAGTTGGGFFTFRRLSEDSNGWYIPPLDGKHFAARTVDAVIEDLRRLIGEAAEADVVGFVTVRIGETLQA